MNLISKTVEDRAIISLVWKFLVRGMVQEGVNFVRYADDCIILMKSEKSCQSSDEDGNLIIEKKLDLKVEWPVLNKG